MALSIVKEDNRFRVEWQVDSGEYSTDWLPDTPSNRKAMVVFLRLLRDEEGNQLFTFQELSVILDSEKRQASSGHVERFRDCGCDFLKFLTRKRKVDSEVVEAVLSELLCDPLAEMKELCERVNARLGRHDLTPANIKVAALSGNSFFAQAALSEKISSSVKSFSPVLFSENLEPTTTLMSSSPADFVTNRLSPTNNQTTKHKRIKSNIRINQESFFRLILHLSLLVFKTDLQGSFF